MFKSRKVISDQIRRWIGDDHIRYEILYVDDRCPQKSKQAVFKAWNDRPDKEKFNVRLILSPANLGFGGACNLGAFQARGKYLVFLNADTTVTPNWLSPIVQTLEEPGVGIVGNLQLKEGGDLHGTVDGAGSEWSWEFMNFMHIGRHFFEGEPLENPLDPDDCPEILVPGEREMVTGCCLSISKELFDNVGGFDLHYRIGYWEDSELCTSVRSLGYKIMYQPKSVIYHKLSHAGVGSHPFAAANQNYFTNKWINTFRLDKLVKDKRIVKPTKVSRIFCKRLDARGDVLVATAILPALKKQYPNAVINFSTKCPEVLRGNPYINEILHPSAIPNASYQLLIDMDLAYERRPFTNLLDAYAELAGVPKRECEPFLAVEDPGIVLPSNYVVVHAGRTAWVGRDWYPERFREIADRLSEKGVKVVGIGGSGDHPVTSEHDLRDKLSIHQTAWVIKHARCFVGIDSFPMHIAQVFNVPGVCFFGSVLSETRLYRENMTPVTAEVPCLGCHHRKIAPSTVTNVCENGETICEKELSLETIWQTIERKIDVT